MTAAGPPRKHHYIPEFYTRRWTNHDGEMIRYARKPNGEIASRRVTPGAIGHQIDLYTLSEENEEAAYSLETGLFRLVDDYGGKSLERLLQGDTLTHHKDRTRWAVFLLSLLFRSPRDLAASAQAFKLMLENSPHKEHHPPNYDQYLARRNLWRAVNNQFIGPLLVEMAWDVIDLSKSDVKLLTSDSPMILSNGLAPPEGNYALPLSPTRLSVTSWGGGNRQRALGMSPTRIAKLANKYTVERARGFVIETDEAQRKFVTSHFSKNTVLSPLEVMVQNVTKQPGKWATL